MHLKQLFTNGPFGKPLFFLPQGTVICGPFQSACGGNISGQCKGDVNVNGSLAIGRAAEIHGNVYTEKLEMYGKVHGNIFFFFLSVVYNTAVIKGDITAAVIEVKEGALIEGIIKKKEGGENIKNAEGGDAEIVDTIGETDTGEQALVGDTATLVASGPLIEKEPEPERSGDMDRDAENWF